MRGQPSRSTNPRTGGHQPQHWQAAVFFYLDSDGSLSEVLEIKKSSQVQDGSDLLCGHLPRATNPRTGGRPSRGVAGTNPSTGRPLYFFILSNDGKYFWSLAFVVGFGLLFLMAPGGFFRAFVQSCPFAFRVQRCLSFFIVQRCGLRVQPSARNLSPCLCLRGVYKGALSTRPVAVLYFWCEEVSLHLERTRPRVGSMARGHNAGPDGDRYIGGLSRVVSRRLNWGVIGTSSKLGGLLWIFVVEFNGLSASQLCRLCST